MSTPEKIFIIVGALVGQGTYAIAPPVVTEDCIGLFEQKLIPKIGERIEQFASHKSHLEGKASTHSASAKFCFMFGAIRAPIELLQAEASKSGSATPVEKEILDQLMKASDSQECANGEADKESAKLLGGTRGSGLKTRAEDLKRLFSQLAIEGARREVPESLRKQLCSLKLSTKLVEEGQAKAKIALDIVKDVKNYNGQLAYSQVGPVCERMGRIQAMTGLADGESDYLNEKREPDFSGPVRVASWKLDDALLKTSSFERSYCTGMAIRQGDLLHDDLAFVERRLTRAFETLAWEPTSVMQEIEFQERPKTLGSFGVPSPHAIVSFDH